MHDHFADAIKAPDLIRLGANLYVARFETMKVYSTLVAVERLLQAGVVDKRSTLLDSSSGIYAYALALACHKFRLKCHIVASQAVDKTLMAQLQILGATVDQVQPAESLKLDQSLRVEKIKALLKTRENFHWMQQYHDDIHYAGYEPVARLIDEAFGPGPLSVVGGIGSGCSTGGIAKPLRKHRDDVALIGVQPFGSMSFHCEHRHDPGIIIAGIGTSIPFRNVQHALYDQIHWVSFDHGLAGSVALLREHAIFAGLSTGCCYLVARREASIRPDRNILFIAADTGHRYAEPVFSRHREALDITTLSPRSVSSTQELELPWSTMAWNRRPGDAAVEASLPGRTRTQLTTETTAPWHTS